MVLKIPTIDVNELINDNRIAASVFNINIKSKRAFTELLNSIESEKGEDLIPGRGRLQTENFFPIKTGYYIKSKIECKIKWREIAPGTDISNIIERTEWELREISAILRINAKKLFVFSERNQDAWEFCNRMRDLTIGRFNPTKINISSNGLEFLLPNFNEITVVKYNLDAESGANGITLRGTDLGNSNIYKMLLKDKNKEYTEIGGILNNNIGDNIKLILNNKCRFWINTKKSDITFSAIKKIMNEIEKAQEIE